LLLALTFALSGLSSVGGAPSTAPGHRDAVGQSLSPDAGVAARVGSVPSAAPPGNTSPFSGVWNTTDGVDFQFTQTAGSSSIATSVLNDPCTGGPRTEFITGSISNGTNVSGTMYRCSPANDTLDKNCGLEAIWSTPYNATDTGGDFINGSYQGQFWTWNVTSNGSWTNCHIAYYFNTTFTIDRIDCGLKSFTELAALYIPIASQRAQEIALSNQLEAAAVAHSTNPGAATPVVWSAAQNVSGGFRSRVAEFQSVLLAHGVHTSIQSAYRPVVYQAHLADIQHCANAMYHHVQAIPGDVRYIAAAVTALNYQIVQVHQFKNPITHQVGSQLFDIPNRVCATPPFTQCQHVDGLAVDMTLSGPMDDIISQSQGWPLGFCRPLPDDDPVHWVYRQGVSLSNGAGCSDSPWQDATFVGHSPIDLLVTSPSGKRIGYDPATSSIVDDYSAGEANYTGPGTEPQTISISANATEPGSYAVSGVGTGNGAYTISYSVGNPDDTAIGDDGGDYYSVNQTGTAINGTAIPPVSFPFLANYSVPSPWSTGVAGASSSGSTTYTVTTTNGTYAPSASSSTVNLLAYYPSWPALDLQTTGVGGSTSVSIPHSMLLGPYTVWTNLSVLPSSTTDSGSLSTVTFQMPSNASYVMILGTSPLPSSGSSSSVPWIDLAIVGVVVAAAVVIGATFLSRRRSQRASAPPPRTP
jgi:hypothetical protein